MSSWNAQNWFIFCHRQWDFTDNKMVPLKLEWNFTDNEMVSLKLKKQTLELPCVSQMVLL